MKEILVAGYFAKNFGDDLFFKILFERYKDVKWIVDTTNRSYSEIFKVYKNVKIRNNLYHKIIKKLKIDNLFYQKLNGAVFIGGSVFMENNGWEKNYHYRKRIFKALKNKNIFFIGCNFGPFKSNEFLEKNKELFEKSTDVCFRDNYSKTLYNDLNNVRVAPDIIFGLKSQEVRKEKNSLGISLIDLEGREDLQEYQDVYIDKITEIIREAVSRKTRVTLFSFCETQGDLKMCNTIINSLDSRYKSFIDIVNYDGDIDNFLYKFKVMENIIGTRFHACILSQVFQQGLYPIVYDNKTYNVLKDIDLAEEYTHINEMEHLDVKHILDNIPNNKLKDINVFSEAEKQFEVLDGYIKIQ